jgi:hypothetical protein
MQELNQPDASPNGRREEAEVAARANPEASTPNCVALNDLVYDLRLGGDNSDGFYRDVAQFSDRVVIETERRMGSWLDGYASYVRVELREADRSRGEYDLDLLILGLALGQYTGAAESTPDWVVVLARELYWLRRETPWTKPWADLGRAFISRLFLAPKIGLKPVAAPKSLDQFQRLLDWLQATGEFEQEIRRLNNWKSFLGTLTKGDARRWMENSVELFDWFEREAAFALGKYTAGVEEFHSKELVHRGIREDQIFCGRPPVEYHLAMVATEVMNRGLRQRFNQMGKKLVLVPACMGNKSISACQAKVIGVDIACTGCDPECTINRITRQMRDQGATVYLVPHSSGFSRWLERWQHEPDTGVVAVACLLNILPGGYEMRARRIPSQCVPLDYPGCEKHWRRDRLPTGLNEKQLVWIVGSSPVQSDKTGS